MAKVESAEFRIKQLISPVKQAISAQIVTNEHHEESIVANTLLYNNIIVTRPWPRVHVKGAMCNVQLAIVAKCAWRMLRNLQVRN